MTIKATKKDKAMKFVELANKRVNKLIKDVQLIANLANKRNYEYTDEQAKKIIRRLQREVDAVKRSFQDTNGGSTDEFRL